LLLFYFCRIKLKVNKLTSSRTLLPVDYYQLPFCHPDVVKRDNENLGEFLAGDKIENSPYLILMKQEMFCEHVCISQLGRGQQKGTQPNKVVKAIQRNYHNNWIMDNLPAASKVEDEKTFTTSYFSGFPIGFISDQDQQAYIHNHVNIEIMYNKAEAIPGTSAKPAYRVVRFIVEPFSINHQYELDLDPADDVKNESYLPKSARITNPLPSCMPGATKHTSYEMAVAPGRMPQLASGKVLFTYDVTWTERNDIHWASRWDIYLTMGGTVQNKVHWISIANSLVIVFVLSAMIGAILVRNLRRDINRYNKLATDEEKAEDLEEYGWKLVHADVFRPPSFSPMLLATMCGTGAQLLGMTFFTIIFSALGFMSPARRGHLIMAQLLLFVSMGIVGGYVTARYYKTFKGQAWQRATLVTAFGFPGLTFFVFVMMNIVALVNKSTDAVPFGTMFVLIVLWFGISVPLVFFGAYFGYKQDAFEFPVNTSSIPRQVPDQPWFMGIPFTLAIGGILPFGSCFVELYYILASVWMDYYYYVFGFLLLVFLILLITCAEITILFTYFQLCSEDYRWWWRSFSNAGSTAVYVFLYSIIYFKQLDASTSATYILYFGYMALICLGMFMMMGYFGVSTSLWFNKVIFASIKID
jgi:transmembrane 9 superfamily member 2/4